jgi:hypothetical protein
VWFGDKVGDKVGLGVGAESSNVWPGEGGDKVRDKVGLGVGAGFSNVGFVVHVNIGGWFGDKVGKDKIGEDKV